MSTLFRKIYESSPQHIYRYFANRKRQNKAKVIMHNYIASHDIRKLHVGCGGNYFDTWLNTDLVPDNNKIAKLDASELFPLPSDSFDYVYSEHLIEHLNFIQQVNFLKESQRILKPGGKVRIATPDFDFLAHLAGDNRTDFDNNYLVWNSQNFLKHIPQQLMDKEDLKVYVINNYFRDWGHQLIHSKSSIKNLLEYCGLQSLRYELVGSSSDPFLTELEHHGLMITDTYNKYETMVIEAEKPGGKRN